MALLYLLTRFQGQDRKAPNPEDNVHMMVPHGEYEDVSPSENLDDVTVDHMTDVVAEKIKLVIRGN